MRALLLLLALTLSTLPLAGESATASPIQDQDALTTLTRDLHSTNGSVRYKAARRFFQGVQGLKDANPAGLNRSDENYPALRELVETLHCAALNDQDQIRVYAIKGLRRVIDLELLPDDGSLVLSIWLDILKIAEDPNEPKSVRQAASGPL